MSDTSLGFCYRLLAPPTNITLRPEDHHHIRTYREAYIRSSI